jgi:hypothetical protein
MFKVGHYIKGDLRGSYSAARDNAWHRRFGVMRVAAFGCVLGGLAIVFATHRAKADVGEAALALGRDLVPLADVLGRTTNVNLNGEHIFMGSVITEEPVKSVLDRFQANCAENPGPFNEILRRLNDVPAEKRTGELKDPQINGDAFRSETANEGTVLCITKGAKSGTTYETAMTAFGQTRDIGSLGKLRYAYARKTSTGSTAVLSAWTEDSFNVDKLAPADGSEPAGNDDGQVARPPSSKRTINAHLEGTPYGVRMYTTTESEANVIAFYDADMAKKGWARHALADHKEMAPELDPASKGTHLYTKGSLQAIVQFASEDGHTSVAIAELGTGEEIVAPTVK